MNKVEIAPMTDHGKSKSIFSVSCGSSVFMVFYMGMAMLNLYKLMYPLSSLDLSTFQPASFVGPLWESPSKLFLRVYLSSQSQFSRDFFRDDGDAAVLLWESKLEGSLSQSFLLCTEHCDEDAPAYKHALEWLDTAERKLDVGLLNAGEGIESTSILLVAYDGITKQARNLMRLMGLSQAEEETIDQAPERAFLKLPDRVFTHLHSNSTVFIHVLITRTSLHDDDPLLALGKAANSNSLLIDKVNLVKYDAPNHIERPKRILFDDVKHIVGLGKGGYAPWDLERSQPEAFQVFQAAQQMKEAKSGYPYWKPEVSIKYIYDGTKYPRDYVGMSGMQLVQTRTIHCASNRPCHLTSSPCR